MRKIRLLGLGDACAAMHRIKRFCGKFERALSVLEHTNLATTLALKDGRRDVAVLLLLHDVPEVYFSDLPYTIKRNSPTIHRLYSSLEREIISIYRRRFAPLPLRTLHGGKLKVLHTWVKLYDVLAAYIEMKRICNGREARLFHELYPGALEISRQTANALAQNLGVQCPHIIGPNGENIGELSRHPVNDFIRLARQLNVKVTRGIFEAFVTDRTGHLLLPQASAHSLIGRE